jgi:AraC family transcriptional regulator
MKRNQNELQKIQKLVGDVQESDLRNVDCYVGEKFAIFIPSVGFCGYAVKPRHIHPAYSFILFFSKDQSIFPVNIDVPADHYLVTFIPPGMPHEEEIKGSFVRYIAILIARDYYEREIASYNRGFSGTGCWKQFLADAGIMIYLKRFMAEYEGNLPGCERILDGLAGVITHELIRNLLETDAPPVFAADRLDIERVAEHMQQHYGEKSSVASLAKLVNMSESNLIRLFNKEKGVAPMEYLIRIRVDKARKLLMNPDNKITEISLQCGFNSASHFSACFAKRFGITPRQYRNMFVKRPK